MLQERAARRRQSGVEVSTQLAQGRGMQLTCDCRHCAAGNVYHAECRVLIVDHKGYAPVVGKRDAKWIAKTSVGAYTINIPSGVVLAGKSGDNSSVQIDVPDDASPVAHDGECAGRGHAHVLRLVELGVCPDCVHIATGAACQCRHSRRRRGRRRRWRQGRYRRRN